MFEKWIKVQGENEANVDAVTASILALVPGSQTISLPTVDPVALIEQVPATTGDCVKDKTKFGA